MALPNCVPCDCQLICIDQCGDFLIPDPKSPQTTILGEYTFVFYHENTRRIKKKLFFQHTIVDPQYLIIPSEWFTEFGTTTLQIFDPNGNIILGSNKQDCFFIRNNASQHPTPCTCAFDVNIAELRFYVGSPATYLTPPLIHSDNLNSYYNIELTVTPITFNECMVEDINVDITDSDSNTTGSTQLIPNQANFFTKKTIWQTNLSNPSPQAITDGYITLNVEFTTFNCGNLTKTFIVPIIPVTP